MTPFGLATLDALLTAGRDVTVQTHFIDTSTGKTHYLLLHQFPTGERRLLVMVSDEVMLPVQYLHKADMLAWLASRKQYHHLAHGQFWKGASA